MKRDRGTDQDDELVVERYSKKPAEFAVALQSLSLDKWPADLKRFLTRKLSVQSALNLFQTNKFFASFAQNNDLWEYYLARDFPSEYAFFEGQCDLETGLISQHAKFPVYIIDGPEHPLYEMTKHIIKNSSYTRRVYLNYYNTMRVMFPNTDMSFKEVYARVRSDTKFRLRKIVEILWESPAFKTTFFRSQKWRDAKDGNADTLQPFFVSEDRDQLIRTLRQRNFQHDEQSPFLKLWNVCVRHEKHRTYVPLFGSFNLAGTSQGNITVNDRIVQLFIASIQNRVEEDIALQLFLAGLLFTSQTFSQEILTVLKQNNEAFRFMYWADVCKGLAFGYQVVFPSEFPLHFILLKKFDQFLLEERAQKSGKIVVMKNQCIGCATAPAKFREDNDRDRHWCSKACFDKYNP